MIWLGQDLPPLSLAHSSRCPSFMRRRYAGSGVASRAYPDNQCRPAANVPAADALGRSGRSTWPRGQGFEQHQHDEHQLAWTVERRAHDGARRASTWVLPPSRALWIPAGLPHTVAVAVASAQMYSLYFRRRRAGALDGADGRLGLSAARRADPAPRPIPTVHDEHRRRAEALVVRSARPDRAAPLHTPVPLDERARFVADALTADPADGPHARGVGPRRGRERADAQPALRRRDRTQLHGVAHPDAVLLPRCRCSPTARPSRPSRARVGYANPSAFIAAFRRVFGVTPGAYFDRPADPAARR